MRINAAINEFGDRATKTVSEWKADYKPIYFFNNAKQMGGKTFFAISDSDLYQLRPACTDGMKYLTPASQKLYEKICDKRIDLTRRRQISKKTHGNGASLITPCARQYAASVLRGTVNAG